MFSTDLKYSDWPVSPLVEGDEQPYRWFELTSSHQRILTLTHEFPVMATILELPLADKISYMYGFVDIDCVENTTLSQ